MSRQTIAEFLEARIAEDREEAEHFLERYKQGEDISKRRWLRVLREAEAKQAILSQHEIDPSISESHCDTCAEWWRCELGEGPPMVKYPCPTVRAIAAVYSDHPDYQQEWAQ